jgi:hypothetical protein
MSRHLERLLAIDDLLRKPERQVTGGEWWALPTLLFQKIF